MEGNCAGFAALLLLGGEEEPLGVSHMRVEFCVDIVM